MSQSQRLLPPGSRIPFLHLAYFLFIYIYSLYIHFTHHTHTLKYTRYIIFTPLFYQYHLYGVYFNSERFSTKEPCLYCDCLGILRFRDITHIYITFFIFIQIGRDTLYTGRCSGSRDKVRLFAREGNRSSDAWNVKMVIPVAIPYSEF